MWTITENTHAVVATAPGKRIVLRNREVLLVNFLTKRCDVLRHIAGPRFFVALGVDPPAAQALWDAYDTPDQSGRSPDGR